MYLALQWRNMAKFCLNFIACAQLDNALKEDCKLNYSVSTLLKVKAVIHVEERQDGAFEVLHIEAINFDKERSPLDSEHCQPSHFGFRFCLHWFFFSAWDYNLMRKLFQPPKSFPLARWVRSAVATFAVMLLCVLNLLLRWGNTSLCLSSGSGLLWARVGGHEENSAAHGRQPVGMETHGSRTATGISDTGGGAPEDPRKTEGRTGPGIGRSSGEPGEVPQASVVTHCSREQCQGESASQAVKHNQTFSTKSTQ